MGDYKTGDVVARATWSAGQGFRANPSYLKEIHEGSNERLPETLLHRLV
jgi:hypothetical protein